MDRLPGTHTGTHAETHTDRVPAFEIGLHVTLLQKKRNLPRHREYLSRNSRRDLHRRIEDNRAPLHQLRIQCVKYSVLPDYRGDFAGAVQCERLLLAQGQQARNMVDIAVGQQDASNRAGSRSTRVQRRGRRKLRTDIG